MKIKNLTSGSIVFRDKNERIAVPPGATMDVNDKCAKFFIDSKVAKKVAEKKE